jgi:hypothetical protein
VPNPFYLANFTDLRTSNPLVYANLSRQGFFTSPIIRKNQLLRAFPHMAGLTQNNAPPGEVRTDALEISFERRFARGFSLNVGYTQLHERGATIFLNEFDTAPSWQEGDGGRPHRLVASGIYEFPFGKGRAFARSGLRNLLFGGFQVGLTFEWQAGPLMNWGNVFYYGNIEDIGEGSRTLDRWFNTDNFERNAAKGPAAFHRRVFPTRIDGLRADMANWWNGNVVREFRFKERLGFQLRLDVLNALNRSQFAAPDLNPYSTNFGRITSTTQAPNRILQVSARIKF